MAMHMLKRIQAKSTTRWRPTVAKPWMHVIRKDIKNLHLAI
jgi:hypothetical protein